MSDDSPASSDSSEPKSTSPEPASRASTSPEPALPEAAWLRRFRRALLAWYRRARRDLPWRRTRDPYAIWVSEVMLQQTQAATVAPYFERFLARFPTAADLAAASEDEVLRHWEGLGYYRRARQLRAAAQALVERHGGAFPRCLEQALELPGVGRYTAGAVLSIAFDAPAPILEANTIRLHARLLGFRGETTAAAGQALLWRFAETLLPAKGRGELNQALMELGSLVCAPKAPNCGACPVAELCAARGLGAQGEIPAPARAALYENVREAAVVIREGPRVLLRRCQPGERWAGLWDFPRTRLAGEHEQRVREELAAHLAQQAGLTVEIDAPWFTLKHGVTRYRITLECRRGRRLAGEIAKDSPVHRWTTLAELPVFPLSSTGRQIGQRVLAEAAT